MNNFKNFDDGAFGRILSYNDLSDRKDRTKKKSSNDDSDESDEEDEEQRRKAEEEERLVSNVNL